MYRQTDNPDVVQRIEDGMFILVSGETHHSREYREWFDAGGALEAAPEEWRAVVWSDYRARRDVYLDRLVGIATFDDAGDGVVKEACRLFRQRLLDLPAQPEVTTAATPTREALEDAIVTLYRAYVSEATAAAPAARAAFSKVSN